MIALCVTIDIKPEHVSDFAAAILENARGARTEPGNLRFDVVQSSEDPGHFILYEVYRDQAALAAHREAPHYKKWIATVESWLVKPRQRVLGSLLFYGDEAVSGGS